MDEEKNRLKYYLYISESKVDMLYSQIPQSIVSHLESELKINLPIVGVSFSRKQVNDSLYSRLQIVVEYIQRNMEIGSVSAPLEYFRGSAFLQWAHIHQGVVFFGGKINDINIGLGGSMSNLLGQRSNHVEIGISHTPWLASLLLQEVEAQIKLLPWQLEIANKSLTQENQNERVLSAASFWAGELAKRPIAKFEFIAKKLVYADHMGEKVLLGTPIYVQYANSN